MDMPSNVPAGAGPASARGHVGAGATPHRPLRRRSRLTNKPISVRANRHTKLGRRIADLFDAYSAALGAPTDTVVVANILTAAELKASAEVLRAKLLAGEDLDVDQLIKVEGLAARAERRVMHGINQLRDPSAAPLRDKLKAGA